MNKTILLLPIIMITGCATVNLEQTSPVKTSPNMVSVMSDQNLTHINHVYVGMTRKEVETVMGESLTIGYVKNANAFEPTTINSPYRREKIKKNGKMYEVLYYFTDIRKSDEYISENELMPVVLEGNIVIGKGHHFLNTLKRN